MTSTPSLHKSFVLRFAPHAMFSSRIDFLCVGGLSIALMLAILAFIGVGSAGGGYESGQIKMFDFLILQMLINWPHFAVSYRLLYRKRANIARFPLATIGVPVALIGVMAASLMFSDSTHVGVVNQRIAYVAWVAAALYLAWHYVGQSWGMIIVYARLSGIKFQAFEARLMRNCLRTLIIWHVVWGVSALPGFWWTAPFQTGSAMILVNTLAVASFIVSAGVLVRVASRYGWIDPRIVAPWLVLYLWYLTLYFEPGAYVFVQLSHALQYLIFPARVELNSLSRQGRDHAPSRRLLLLYCGSVLAGLLIFYVPDLVIGSTNGDFTIGGMLAVAANIHHYYTDGAIWKLRDPDIRKNLFSHLPVTSGFK